MSKLLKFTVPFLLFALCAVPTAQAQTSADEVSVKTFWKEVWAAYESGNTEQVMKFYTDNAASITPDGRLQSGKKAMKEDWESFMKMVDAPPKFTYEAPSVRFITAEIAIVTYDSAADIKIGGQQVGGKMLGMALLRKVKGQWMIEFDSMTPKLEMPAPEQKGN